MKEKDCIFCKIAEGEIPSKKLFENDLNLAFLDISPISKGHTIIISKNHYKNLEEIPDYELTEIYKVVKNLAIKIRTKLKIVGYNVLQNNYAAAGQVINHFHVHIIPRNFEDEKFQIKIPRTQALEGELNEFVKEIILEPRTRQRGFLNHRYINKLINEYETGQRNHSYLLWSLVILELWQRNYLDH